MIAPIVVEPNPYANPQTTESRSTKRVSYRSLWTTLVLAVFLVYVAAGQIWMPLGLAVLIVPTQAILLLFALFFRRHHENAVRLRLIRIAIYGVALVAAQWLAILQMQTVADEAQELVVACESFARDHGRLPTTLEELVPHYRPSIPAFLGRYAFLSRVIYYYVPPEESRTAEFVYRLTPDHSRRYSFETHEWTPP